MDTCPMFIGRDAPIAGSVAQMLRRHATLTVMVDEMMRFGLRH